MKNKSSENIINKADNTNQFRKIGVPLIDVVDSMEKLRALNPIELPWLADDIRKEIINVVSQNGGHLGPSLGVVELTIALHYVFNTPNDKIIWDVGHQSYAHKILTGRYKQFKTLRKKGGLSGFTKRAESIFDPFGAGHSSTSISAGLGMASARDIKGQEHNIICVIGDGSMSAGMAFEAMNNAGDMNSKLIVILNDNDMSISPPVGALSTHLSKIISSKQYMSIRNTASELVSLLPKALGNVAKRTESYARGLVTGGTLFEELGFFYVGPIDGHTFEDLIPVFENIRDNKKHKSFLIHVRTKKGHGYNPAEKSPTAFHGVYKFDIVTGELKNAKTEIPSCTQGFSKIINYLAQEDDKVVAITAAMPSGTGLAKFAENFPSRFFDVGIAEQHAVTFAAGMAVEGIKPFVAIYSSFLQRAYDQIVHDVVLQGLPVRFMIDRAGLVGEDGVTHHGLYDISMLANLHNVVIMAPSSYNEVLNMVKTAYSIDDRPSFVRYPKGCLPYVEPITSEFGQILKIGKARIIKNSLNTENTKADLAILSLGSRLFEAMKASEMLEKEGFSVSIVDARFAKPFDTEMVIKLAKTHKALITVEEGANGGFGAEIAQFLTDEALLDSGLKFRAIAIKDNFIHHATVSEQLAQAGLDAENIKNTAINMLKIERLNFVSNKSVNL